MSLHRELLATIFALMILNLALAFGSIGLFVRMGPAIERILEKNMATIATVEEILFELATLESSDSLAPETSARVSRALDDIEATVTEVEEKPIVFALRRRLPNVFGDDPKERKAFTEDLRRLLLVNREAMHQADADAQRLGSAGAWSAVLIGFGGFLLSIFLLRRLQRRIVQPVSELHRVLQAVRSGNRQRRCPSVVNAPREIHQVTSVINELLDERLSLQQGAILARGS